MTEYFDNCVNTFEEVANHLEDLEDAGGWEIYYEKNKIYCMRRLFEDQLYIYNFTTTLPAHPNQVSDYLWDDSNRKSWDLDVKDFYVLKSFGAQLKLVYRQLQYAWPSSHREVLAVEGIRKSDSGKVVLGYKSLEIPQREVMEDFVRADLQIGGFILKPEECGCKVSFILKLDPKGSIPYSICNSGNARYVAVIENLLKRFSENI